MKWEGARGEEEVVVEVEIEEEGLEKEGVEEVVVMEVEKEEELTVKKEEEEGVEDSGLVDLC